MIWLGFALPENIAKNLFEIDPQPAVQTHKFGWAFAKALSHSSKNIVLASSYPVQKYPLVPRIIFRGERFKEHGLSGISMGFINMILFKHMTRLASCIVNLYPIIRRDRVRWLFIHGVHSPYLLFGLFVRRFGLRVVVVLTDPPGVLLPTDSLMSVFFKKLDVYLVKSITKRMDGVISLAPELAQQLSPNSPSLIFPGILDEQVSDFFLNRSNFIDRIDNGERITIVYAGGLSSRYGVDLLIDAVLRFDASIPVHLKLFGKGDQEARVKALAASDRRFSYGGFIDAEQLLPELAKADLLINPRPTTESFAVLSFPSKLIEYLAIGQCVLTTRIRSIPPVLRNHFYYIDDETSGGINSAILTVLGTPKRERELRAKSSQEVVRSEFSTKAIGNRISEFMAELNNEIRR